MSLLPRFVQSEFAPMFRLLDDYGNHLASRGGDDVGSKLTSSMRSFQPRFDVKENKDNYELHGELPGVAQDNIHVEWQDATTITIKGHTDSRREQGTRPAGFVEGSEEQAKITQGEANGTFHKARVEDEAGTSEANNEVSEQTTAATQPKSDGSKYWLFERQYGSFARSFSFPSRVDQDNVKASLKNGILSIMVPKAAAPVARRINIE